MRVLILAYDFPPLPSIGGFRPYSWYKYFPEAGIYPIVITRDWSQNIDVQRDKYEWTGNETKKTETPNSLLIQLPHKLSFKERIILKNGLNKKVIIRKIITLSEEIFKYKTLKLDDKHYIYEHADEFMSKNKVDCIIATGEPFILFKYGHNLSKKYNVPWFADYRDGWSTDHSRQQGMLAKLVNFYFRKYEKEYTNNAIGFSSVSLQVLEEIKHTISLEGVVIPNGVDLDMVNSVPDIDISSETFVIVFTGTIYQGQKVQEFLTAYKNFLTKGEPKKALVKFIGIGSSPNENVSRIINFSKEFPNNLVVIPRISHRESIAEQKKASLLLNFILGSQSEGLIGGKTYEYFAIKKPILVISVKEEKNPPLFPERNVQYFSNIPEEIEWLLEKFYNQFKKGKPLTTNITDDELYSISRKKQALALAEYIKNKVSKFI
jgi:glycosyltransferase involved in cell wall biosynthesis